MRTIFLIRHGRPQFDGPRVCLGQKTDPPVQAEDLEMARWYKKFFTDKNVENYYCSPLLRAQQTLASFLPNGKKANLLPGIIEASYGNWEGVDITLLPKGYGQSYIDSCRGVVFPNYPDIGQPEHVRDAANRAYEAVRSTKGTSVIVSHTTIISLFCSKLIGLPWEEYHQLHIPYLSLTEVREENGKWKLVEYGRDHLGIGTA